MYLLKALRLQKYS